MSSVFPPIFTCLVVFYNMNRCVFLAQPWRKSSTVKDLDWKTKSLQGNHCNWAPAYFTSILANYRQLIFNVKMKTNTSYPCLHAGVSTELRGQLCQLFNSHLIQQQALTPVFAATSMGKIHISPHPFIFMGLLPETIISLFILEYWGSPYCFRYFHIFPCASFQNETVGISLTVLPCVFL